MIHINHTVCGGVAFLYSHKPEANAPILSAEATLLTGAKPEPNSPIKCGACSRFIWNPRTELTFGDEVQTWDHMPWA